MGWFRNRSISTKLMLSFSALLLLTGLLGVFAVRQLAAVEATASDLGGNMLNGTRLIDQISLELNAYRRKELRFLIVGLTAPGDVQAREQAEKDLQSEAENLDSLERAYEPLIDDPEEKQIYDRYLQKRADYLAASGKSNALIRTGKTREAAALADAALAAFTNVSDVIAADSDFQKKQSDEAVQHSTRTFISARFWILALLGTSVCAGLLLALGIARLISKPMSEVGEVARQIAEGDLTGQEVAVTSTDEVGELSRNINKMHGKLRNIIASIGTNAQQVATASEEFSATSQQITVNSEETSAQANRVSTATEQVNRNLQTVATSTEEMSATISEIAKNASEAAKVAGEALHASLETNATVTKLGESSVEIGQVIKVITSIA